MTTINSEAVERAVEDAIIASPWFDIDREGVRQSGLATAICTNIAALTAQTERAVLRERAIEAALILRQKGYSEHADALTALTAPTPADDVVERQCDECKGSGVAEYIDHMARRCDACRGDGTLTFTATEAALLDTIASQQARIAALVEGLKQIAETPNSGWTIACDLLNQEPSK